MDHNKFLTLALSLGMTAALTACNGSTAAPSTPPVSPSAPAIQSAVPSPEGEAQFEAVKSGDIITKEFAEITLGTVGSGAKMTEGNSSRLPSNESNQLFWLSGTLTNTSGNAFPLYSDRMPVSFVFDGKYTYEGDVYCFTAVDMDPLVKNNIYLYAEVPPALLESWKTLTVRFAFNDAFAEYDYEANDYELALENYDNLYEFTANRENTESGTPAEEGTAPVSGETELHTGDVITTPDYEFTLNGLDFSYEVMPDDTSGYYSYYSPESGNVYIHIDATIKNLMKRDLQVGDIFRDVKAIYGEGYTYNGFPIVSDGSTFNFASSWSVAAPLQTCHAHYIIECPQEVESSSDPLYMTMELADGNVYRFDLR